MWKHPIWAPLMFYLLIRQDVYSKRHAKEAAKYRGGAKVSPRKGIAKRK